MPRIDDEYRQEIKQQVWLMIQQNPGIKTQEIASRLNLQVRRLNYYLPELRDEGKIRQEGWSWYSEEFRGPRLYRFDLLPVEVVTLYLGARLLVKQHDHRNEPAETALRKLAAVLRSDVPIGKEIARVADDLAKRHENKQYQSIFRMVAEAYAYRKKIKLVYKPLGEKAFETVFETYLIEPSLVGAATYIIGKSSIDKDRREHSEYKLGRIQSAETTSEPYKIPEKYQSLDVMRDAWSVIGGEAKEEVELRFSPKVVERVEETKWHPLQETSPDPEKPGWLRWKAKVPNTLDMRPWIKGWGADCEVLKPKPLREALIREAQSLAELYKVMEVKKELFAHFREKDKDHKEPQYLWDHLNETSQDAERFAAKIGLPEIGKVLGLLHDFGKASKEYQDYLKTNEGLINPDEDGYSQARRGEIDHSTAGAQLIFEKLANKGQEGKILAQFLSLAIASHHSGLIDCLKPDGTNEFQRRITKREEKTHFGEAKRELPEIEKILDESLLEKSLQEFTQKINGLQDGDSGQTKAFKEGLLLRFLLSCLLDADRLNTAKFESPADDSFRNDGKYPSWEILIERFNVKLNEFAENPSKNNVDKLRDQISQACLDFAVQPKGVYQLTVPTGGGKTLASLRFALNHAAHYSKSENNKLDRIFYIIPYTSIIDQNADDIRKILEDRDEKGNILDKVVLEHHSNLTPEEETRRQNLLAQNWDAPIVFTTQVQFLETLFGAGTRSARRMHQLANSVIIFDEVQAIPIKCLHMFNIAVRFLVRNCGATVVLCTATQPPLDRVGSTYRALSAERIIQDQDEANLFKELKRVEVLDERGNSGKTDEEIADLAEQELQRKGSVLIVVNTKKSARTLYKIIAQRNIAKTYHLSTNMCPAHRSNVLNAVKAMLVKDPKEPVICVSTQLIEAGVDIDFGAVIRYLAGLDSITQAAGRCNRNGKQKDKDGNPTLGRVLVVKAKNENADSLTDIVIGTEQAKRILDQFKANPEKFGNDRIGLTAVAEYYKWYFAKREDEMRYKVGATSPIGREDNLFNALSINTQTVEASGDKELNLFLKQSFQSAAKSFEVIDLQTRGVIVPYGKEGKEIIEELKKMQDIGKRYALLKKAQKYSVNLRSKEFNRMRDNGIIQEVQDAEIYYMEEAYYDEKQLGWLEDPFLEV